MCKTWKKNSFGLFNYHNPETELVKSHLIISNTDTKILRHEKLIEVDSDLCRLRQR